jgi:hypothetical protein
MNIVPPSGDGSPEPPGRDAAKGDASTDFERLLPQHREKLRSSAISDEVAKARGFRSATTRRELKDKGFSDGQQLVPALLIPLHDVSGEIANYQCRPDEPRVTNGKKAKYELPKGSSMRLDINPLMRALLGDPSTPLLISEGILKGDAAASIGLCCLVLLGVWCFRGKNEFGAVTALGDWEVVALKGRRVVIAFDSDVMLKAAVYGALVRLKKFLEAKGADVFVVYLPSGDGGVKTGLDDYIAAGHDRDDILALATKELRRPEGCEEPNERHPYVARPEGMFMIQWDRDGIDESPRLVQLSTFTAMIVEEVVEDNGAETKRLLHLRAQQGEQVVEFDLTPERFLEMKWPVEAIGPGAILLPGASVREHARAAIQFLSGNPPCRRVYRHTGWTEVGGASAYLHGGGAVAAGGGIDGVDVSLPAPLEPYDIKVPENADVERASVRASLAFLDLAPDDVTVPLYCATWTAPLGPSESSVFLVGLTGSGKTELIALAMQHFGAGFNAQSLPAGFDSTSNSLEILQHAAKDALMAVDDWVPVGGSNDVDRANRDADRVFRGHGNRSSRQRLDKNLELRAPRPPRCTLISSGEDTPRGRSLRARLVVVEIEKKSLDWNRLTAAQADAAAGVYAKAMGGFIRFLASRHGKVVDGLRAEVAEVRDLLTRDGMHRRVPNAFARLLVGLRWFLRYAESIGAIDAARREEIWRRALVASAQVAARQSDVQDEAEPAERTLRLVRAAFVSGEAHLVGSAGGPPTDAENRGWQELDTGGKEGPVLRPRGRCVGWQTEQGVAFDADAMFAVVQKIAREQGEPITFTLSAVLKRMHELGHLLRVEKRSGKTRYRCRMSLQGHRPDVVLLPTSLIFVADGSEDATGPGTGTGTGTGWEDA